MTPDFIIDDIEKAYLRIKVLGYPNKGESIMISLRYDEVELYNIITDCYEIYGSHSWANLLSGNTRIDAFIWTHPDEDHSLGVQTLLDKFDPDGRARIFVPTSLTKDLLERNNKQDAVSTYLYLKNKYNKGRRRQWNEVSLSEYESPRFFISKTIFETKTNVPLDFKLGFMAPIGSIVNRRIDIEKMSSGQMNDMSLFFIVQINSVNYIFGGDLAKQTIQFLDEEHLNNCRFIKIPHHGSKDSIRLVDRIQPLQSSELHSVTTVFGDSNPFDVVLDKYAEKNYSVYSTGRGKEPYGLVEFDYNIKKQESYTVKIEGNAHKARP